VYWKWKLEKFQILLTGQVWYRKVSIAASYKKVGGGGTKDLLLGLRKFVFHPSLLNTHYS
jgi:hypothetical protein